MHNYTKSLPFVQILLKSCLINDRMNSLIKNKLLLLLLLIYVSE